MILTFSVKIVSVAYQYVQILMTLLKEEEKLLVCGTPAHPLRLDGVGSVNTGAE